MPSVRKKANPEEARIAKALEALYSSEQKSILVVHKLSICYNCKDALHD